MTIPLRTLFKWKLSAAFMNAILRGDVIEDSNHAALDGQTFRQWETDASQPDLWNIVMTEIECRVRRVERCYVQQATLQSSEAIQDGCLDYIGQIALFILRNYDSPITVKDIGAAVGLHPDYANSVFKRTLGHSISEHLILERITQAQHRLLFSSERVSTIAYEVGYESISNFNLAFKKVSGCSPSEYRESHDR